MKNKKPKESEIKKLILVIVALIVLMMNNSYAQNFVGIEYVEIGEESNLSVVANQVCQFSDEWGISAFCKIDTSYAYAYVGPTYSPTDWLLLGLSAGLEQADNPWRVGATVWAEHQKCSTLHVFETGGSGFWCRNQIDFKLTDRFATGVMGEYLLGIGPKFQVKVGKLQCDFILPHDFKTKNTNMAAFLTFSY